MDTVHNLSWWATYIVDTITTYFHTYNVLCLIKQNEYNLLCHRNVVY